MQKWQKWLWVVLALVISSSIYLSIRYGLRPKPIPIMKPTSFSSLEEMGVVTYRRLRQQIRSEKVLVLGVELSDPEGQNLWVGLMKAAVADKVTIQDVFVDSRIESSIFFQGFKTTSFVADAPQDLKDTLIKGRRRNGLVIVLASNQDSSHLRKDSLTKILEKSPLGPIMSLSQMPLILNKEILEEKSESCADLDMSDFLSRSECVVYRFSKQHLRRKLSPEKLYGGVERYGLKEYLIFIHRP